MHSIRFRMIGYFFVLILLPVLITVSITQFRAISIITDKADESIQSTLEQTRINVGNLLDKARATANAFILNTEIKNLLAGHMVVDDAADFRRIKSLMTLMSDLVHSSTSVNSIYIYDLNDDILMSSSQSALENSGFSKTSVYARIIEQQQMMRWVALPREQNPFSTWDDMVCFVMPIRIYEQNLTVGYAIINVMERTIYSYLNSARFMRDSRMMLVDREGMLLSGEDKSALGELRADWAPPDPGAPSPPRQIKAESGGHFGYITPFSDGELFLEAHISADDLGREIYALRNSVLLVSLLTVMAAALLAFAFTRSLYRPIDELVKAMGSLSFRPDFSYRIESRRRDEFGRLFHSFNKMVVDIKQLFEQLLAEKLKRKEAQLWMLQSQINPHFLYNTLNSIYCISRLHRVNEIAELASAMTNFFRISFSGGVEFISVRETLDQLKYYVQIQNLRREGQLTLVEHVEQELMELTVLKLLLQPLVENSVTHGYPDPTRPGTIEVTGKAREGVMIFRVRDEGCGIPPDELARLTMQLEFYEAEQEERASDAFALSNIQQRIWLYYGGDYGIQLRSEESRGTTVEVTLPRQNDKAHEERRDV